MATVTVSKALIGKEDISFEDADTTPSTFTRTAAGGSTQSITKLAAAHLNIEDAGSLITATTVEGALAEIAADIDSLQVVAADGQGADIASAATVVLPSAHLYFDVTGTTDISTITVDAGGAAGRLIMLQFDSNLTVKSSSSLRIAGDFETVTGAILTLIYDGSSWREIARAGGTTSIWTGGNPTGTSQGVTIHSGPFTANHNEELGDVQATSGADIAYSFGLPLNGFVGGENDRSF